MSHMEMIFLRMTKSMFWRLLFCIPLGLSFPDSFQILAVLFLLGILKPWCAFWCDSCSQLHHCTRNKEMWGFSYSYQHPAPPALTTPALANTEHWSKLSLQRVIVPENWKQPPGGFGFFSSIVLKPSVYRHATDIYFGAFNYLCLADGWITWLRAQGEAREEEGGLVLGSGQKCTSLWVLLHPLAGCQLLVELPLLVFLFPAQQDRCCKRHPMILLLKIFS